MADPNDVPLGSGLAERARSALRGRRSRIDDALKEAESQKAAREQRAKDAGSEVRDSAPREEYIEDET